MGFRARYLILLAVLSVYHLQGLPAQEAWGDDWAQYVAHAMNIRDGAPYDRFPYQFTPESNQYFPRVYPPGYPVLLAALSAFTGWNVWAWKAMSALFWIGGLAALPFALRGRLRDGQILVLAALLGANPLAWNIKTHLFADIPYFFLSLLALGCIRPREEGEYGWGRAVLAGALMTLAVSFRTAGVVLPVSVGLAWLWAWAGTSTAATLAYRRFCFRTLLITGPLITLLLQAAPAAHTAYLHITPNNARPLFQRVFWNLKHYLLAESLDYAGGNSVLLAMFLLCAGWGVWRLVRGRRWDVLEIHTLLIFAVVSLWPFTDPRFLLPAIPAMLLYAIDGWDGLSNRLSKQTRTSMEVATLLFIAFVYARNLPLQRRLAGESIASPPARELIEWVAGRVPAGELIVFSKSRTLALRTGKTTVAIPPIADPRAMNRRLCALHVKWVITFPATAADQEFLQPWVRASAAQLDLRYTNQEHTVYQRNPVWCLQ